MTVTTVLLSDGDFDALPKGQLGIPVYHTADGRVWPEPEGNPLVDSIFAIRVRNNVPWKRLMEIALKHAPDETRAVLREINANDRAVSDLLGELAK